MKSLITWFLIFPSNCHLGRCNARRFNIYLFLAWLPKCKPDKSLCTRPCHPCTVQANTARFLLSILTLLLISFSPFAHLLLPLSIVVDPFFAMMPTESRIRSGKSSIPQIVILLLPISFQIGNQIQDSLTGGCNNTHNIYSDGYVTSDGPNVQLLPPTSQVGIDP